MGVNLSEKDKSVLVKLMETVDAMPETEKHRILGIAEGISIQKQIQEEQNEESNN